MGYLSTYSLEADGARQRLMKPVLATAMISLGGGMAFYVGSMSIGWQPAVVLSLIGLSGLALAAYFRRHDFHRNQVVIPMYAGGVFLLMAAVSSLTWSGMEMETLIQAWMNFCLVVTIGCTVVFTVRVARGISALKNDWWDRITFPSITLGIGASIALTNANWLFVGLMVLVGVAAWSIAWHMWRRTTSWQTVRLHVSVGVLAIYMAMLATMLVLAVPK